MRYLNRMDDWWMVFICLLSATLVKSQDPLNSTQYGECKKQINDSDTNLQNLCSKVDTFLNCAIKTAFSRKVSIHSLHLLNSVVKNEFPGYNIQQCNYSVDEINNKIWNNSQKPGQGINETFINNTASDVCTSKFWQNVQEKKLSEICTVQSFYLTCLIRSRYTTRPTTGHLKPLNEELQKQNLICKHDLENMTDIIWNNEAIKKNFSVGQGEFNVVKDWLCRRQHLKNTSYSSSDMCNLNFLQCVIQTAYIRKPTNDELNAYQNAVLNMDISKTCTPDIKEIASRLSNDTHDKELKNLNKSKEMECRRSLWTNQQQKTLSLTCQELKTYNTCVSKKAFVRQPTSEELRAFEDSYILDSAGQLVVKGCDLTQGTDSGRQLQATISLCLVLCIISILGFL